LKLRGSYGILGNQEIGNYLYSASIANNINYVAGSDQHKWVGSIQTGFATPDIRWETTRTVNAGLDASILNNALSFTFDWFDKETYDILLNVPIPVSTGSNSTPTVNAGKISNKGFELGLNYNGSAGKFDYNIFGTASHVKNKIIELGTGTQQLFGGSPALHAATTTVSQAGGEIGEFFLRKMVGIFQSDEEVKAYNKNGVLIQPNAKAGDIKYLDVNDDGVISDLDRVHCGSPFPTVEYGLGFNGQMHGIDLSVYFQGVAGNKIYNGVRHELEGMNLEQNYSRATLNAWTPENHSTNMPRAVINDPNYNAYSSSRYLENGSYLRLKTLQVGYSFEETLLQKIKIRSLRAYISADNLLTITSYTGFNPDLGGAFVGRGVDRDGYPLARTISFGIQISM
ncbi:MAG: TonB-dependent receptor, partial [Bacteroidales bacterium]|nr:TonB-dependent receptor [Bacteroidales bacterium]